MGWSYGVNSDGREVGYAVQATCDHPECNVAIDRGLSYICGGMMDGGEHGCGKFFCSQHLNVTLTGPATVQLCRRCLREYEREHPDESIEDQLRNEQPA